MELLYLKTVYFDFYLAVLKLSRENVNIFFLIVEHSYPTINAQVYIKIQHNFLVPSRGCPRGVMVKVIDCGIVVRVFVLQSRHYVHFRADTLGKGINTLILQAMG